MPSAEAAAAARARNPIGAHVPVAGGLAAKGTAYADRIAAEAVQVFVSNPRGWATGPGDPAQDDAFRAYCAETGTPAYVHAPYLINFGSHTEATADLSVASMRHALRRGRRIGALGVVVHTGSATGGRPRREALAQVRERVRPLLEELAPDDAPWLLLEPTAGQGASLCSLAEDLGPYLDALDRHPKVGLCLDTCHLFAAGHDLTAPDGVADLFARIEDAAGPGRVRLVHANDSKAGCGSHLDRHENVGAGRIGAEPFRALLAHPATAGVPFVVETPSPADGSGHAADTDLLRSLRTPSAWSA
ncbi:deoxyribonuclease IV [Actinacidiphila yeochonensis]|uniref:deoxyribonuclease IV n=1 Tax=Actinacidiphila yeochonensis TaxID=89050 RepID=UPI000565332C|nr:deoxyribonuclease IV [Actinacidiphila yeochonensis]